MRECTVHSAFFLALCSLSQAQSDLNTAELSSVVTVCGGTVVILCLVWFGICYGHWKIEKNFCEFKKRLRMRREQYWRQCERQSQQYQQRPRDRRRNQEVPQPSAPPRPLSPQTDRRFKPTLISQSASMEFTNAQRNTVPPSRSQADQQNQLLPPSNSPRRVSSSLTSEKGLMKQPQPQSVTLSELAPVQTHTTTRQLKVPAITGEIPDNDSMQSTRTLTNQVQHCTLKEVQEVNFRSSPSDQQMHRTTQIPHIVLGPYSPRSLREEEEMDLELDVTSTPPRYSWIFPEKKERLSQSDGNSPYSFLTPTHSYGDGRGREKTVRDMTLYGQLTSWPQLA